MSTPKTEALKRKIAGKMGSREIMTKLSPNRRYQNPKKWAETHGQKEGKQLKGTITSKKFGPNSY